MEAEIGVMQPQNKEYIHQKLEEARNRISPRASRGSVSPLTP